MVIQSRFSAQIPNCSIQTWIFGSPSGHLRYGDSKAWIDADSPEDRFLTFSSARLLAKRIALGLTDAGLEPGDRVLVISDNSVVYPVIVFGIWMAGGIFTGANSASARRELSFQLRDSQAKFLLAAEACWDVAMDAASLVGLPQGQVFLVDGMLPGPDIDGNIPQQHWARLWAPIERAENFEWMEPDDAGETTCALNYSSGTVRE
jgi:4-coumarate--CoA ligase